MAGVGHRAPTRRLRIATQCKSSTFARLEMCPLAIAVRNLARNRRRTSIAVGALAIAVAALVASRGFINAQHRAMLDAAVDGQLGALQIFRAGASANVSRSPLQFDFDDT